MKPIQYPSDINCNLLPVYETTKQSIKTGDRVDFVLPASLSAESDWKDCLFPYVKAIRVTQGDFECLIGDLSEAKTILVVPPELITPRTNYQKFFKSQEDFLRFALLLPDQEMTNILLDWRSDFDKRQITRWFNYWAQFAREDNSILAKLKPVALLMKRENP